MARKPNHAYEKRQRELAKRAKREAKRMRKQAAREEKRGVIEPDSTGDDAVRTEDELA